MLTAIRLNFEAQLSTADHGLRFLGPTLRGAFGYVLKATVCQVSHGQCHRCLLRAVCPYPLIFEGLPPAGRELLGRGTAVPQPFVVDVAAPGEWSGPPEALRWGITLFGDACRWAPYVIEAFIRIGHHGVGPRRVPFTLQRVSAGHGGGTVWLQGDDRLNLPAATPIPRRPMPHDGELRLRFLTPVHLRQEGSKLLHPDPLSIVLAGRRRFMMLSHFFGGVPMESMPAEERLEATEFQVVSAELRDWGMSRHSGRQQRSVRLDGVVGEVVSHGPWSRAGDWISSVDATHLGKYATFGLGRVTWEQ